VFSKSKIFKFLKRDCGTIPVAEIINGKIEIFSKHQRFLIATESSKYLLIFVLYVCVNLEQLYSEFFLRLAIGFYMLIFQPPVNFCSDENIQTIFGRKSEDFSNYRIDYNSISQPVEKVVKKIFLCATVREMSTSRALSRPRN
jgi:hypothetical protein